MREIKIEYKRWRFFDKKMTIQFPESWKDMSPAQFCTAARVYIEDMTETNFLSAFYGVSKSVVSEMSPFQRYRLMDLLSFALNPDGQTNAFYLPDIPGTGLKSPEPKLKNVTVEHFCIIDTYFFQIGSDNNDEALDMFVAAVYLKRAEKISAVEMTSRLKKVARIDKSTKYAIFLNYIFIRRWLSKVYPFLFQSDEEKPSGKLPQKVSKKNIPDWNGMIDSVVGDDILNHENYKQLPCKVFFKTVNYRLKLHSNGR